jgi:hypothetical protein
MLGWTWMPKRSSNDREAIFAQKKEKKKRKEKSSEKVEKLSLYTINEAIYSNQPYFFVTTKIVIFSKKMV